MGASHVDSPLAIRSYQGIYQVHFKEDLSPLVTRLSSSKSSAHIVIDRCIAELYKEKLAPLLALPSTLIIEATEHAKSLEMFPSYIEHFVSRGIRRNHTLVGVGGGIIQDIVCFLAAIILRGIPWEYIPTTLLAQADSCIGSKSSINVGSSKNIVGTFTPPQQVTISSQFLDSLSQREIFSGIGEMLKVHAIKNPGAFDSIAADYRELLSSRSVLLRYIYESLLIKKDIIEKDEFDRDLRHIMNYGHSFGHAIESATNFKVPHGIAVTLGMDAENFISARLGIGSLPQFERMHKTLQQNAPAEYRYALTIDDFLKALLRDKKNLDQQVTLILPDENGILSRRYMSPNEEFRSLCAEYFSTFY